MKICDTYLKKGSPLFHKKIELIKSGMSPEEASKCFYAFCPSKTSYYYAINIVKIPKSNVFLYDNGVGEYIEWLGKICEEKMLKGTFDIVIQNPPYDGGLHLLFLKQGLDMLNITGKMTIIEPSKWLIDVRKYGKRGEFGRVNSSEIKKYDTIKNQLEGHVKSITIENLNKNFGTGLYAPFSITVIDMAYSGLIEFTCCGKTEMVKSLYDCNLIGNYKTIWSIFEKVQKYGDMMNNHITKQKMIGDYWYAKYSEIISLGGCAATTGTVGCKYDAKNVWINTSNGDYCTCFVTTAYHTYGNEISQNPLCSYDRSHKLTDKIADNVYGTKQELENWKHFIFNNKLPLFLNIVLTIDQHNNSKEFLPWLVDKQYTDDEIDTFFGFTEEEIKLMDDTLKKFERNSPWFKRYMCGCENQDEPLFGDSDPIEFTDSDYDVNNI